MNHTLLLTMAEQAAKGTYAADGWARPAAGDDDGKGRYRDSSIGRLRIVEWDELDGEMRSELVQEAFHGLAALVAAGWVFVAPTTPHVPRVEVS